MKALLLLLVATAAVAVAARPITLQSTNATNAGRHLNADVRACLEVTATRSGVAALARDVFWGGNRITYDPLQRGTGIRNWVCPYWIGNLRNVPKPEDCSSFVAWLFWTALGQGPDYLGGKPSWGRAFNAYATTGDMRARGTKVTTSTSAAGALLPGDLCFYHGPTTDHVAIHVGGGQVVSLGSSSKFAKNQNGNMPQYSQVDYIMGPGGSFWFLECRRYDAFPA